MRFVHAFRAFGAGMLGGLLLTLSACHSADSRAAGNEALYDQLMTVKAYPAARFSIKSAIKIHQDEPRYWLKLAEVEAVMGNLPGSAAAYHSALDLQPDSVEALQALSAFAMRTGAYDDAKRYVDPLLLLAPTSLTGQIVSGAIAINDKRYGDADKIADGLIATNPEGDDGYMLKARRLSASGQIADAAALLGKRAVLSPNNVEMWQQLLQFRRTLGDDAGAGAAAIHLAAIVPDDPGYALLAARALHTEGKDAEARSAVRQLGRRFGGSPSVMRAVAGFWRDTLPAAAAREEIAGMARTASPPVKLALADVLLDLKAAPAVLALIGSQAGEAVTARNLDVQMLYARALADAGRAGDARNHVTQILTFDPTNTTALMLRANIAFAAGDYASALADAQLASSNDLDNEPAALLVGRIYMAEKNVPLTALALGGALRHFPNSVLVMRTYADWLVGQKRGGEAVDIAREFQARHLKSANARLAYAAICKAARQTCPIVAAG